DLNKVFELQQRVVYFDLDDPTFDVPAALEEVLSGTEEELVNDTMTGLEVRIAPEFYSKIIRHPSVEKYFAGTPAMLQLLNQQRE
ncbi:major capsid protein, partial [Mammaliicoccus sciuri]